ncbi:MAG: tRNA preQ1(34) S-adenosylmethionine ribosyltransferase-isomerase QueA [Chloroflexota bacterium]
MDLRTKDFDYVLPPRLIAQTPAPERDQSRLMVIHRETGTISHRTFRDLPEYLDPGDLLIANRSRVIPSRLSGWKESGGKVELLLLNHWSAAGWGAMARPSRRLRAGTRIEFADSELRAELGERTPDGIWQVEFRGVENIVDEVRRLGRLALPPYIKEGGAPLDRYQTVYADKDGSIAAPTAGLHFTDELIDTLRKRGIPVEYVTLHVGLGTFRPVAVEAVKDHVMDGEWGDLHPSLAAHARHVRATGHRIIAVGTTTTRLLESSIASGTLRAFRGETDMFIVPGHRFRAVDALITNFHLPRSTLLMLVSAFAGRDLIMRAYQEAIEREYRFYSFGDAMLVL